VQLISARPFPAAIALTLVDGRQICGRIESFSPYAPDLTVDLDEIGPAGRKGQRVPVRGETVAVVAFHSVLGAPRVEPKANLRRYKLHLITGEVMLARAPPTLGANALGFYAIPDESDWDVREYFVYNHGLHRSELNEPLGAVLVEEGLASSEAVGKGLELQRREREKLLGEILVDRGNIGSDDVERALASQERRKLRIGEILVEASLVTQDDLEAAIGEQRQRRGKRVGQILVESGLVTEEALMLALSKKFNLPFVNLDEVQLESSALAYVPRGIVENLGILPLYADKRNLIVAICDPLAVNATDLLRNHVDRTVIEVLATPSQLALYLQGAMESDQEPLPQDKIGAILDTLSNDPTFKKLTETGTTEPEESDSGVIRLVNHIITEAYRSGASDIHIEPNGRERDLNVRFRIDGRCINFHQIPRYYSQAVVARIKIMATLDIAERRKPQDGKIRFAMHERVIELRVATLPTVNDNEDVVMRILASSKPIPLEKMMLSERNLREMKTAVNQPYGLVLCVGPTGSGKTTTLHSALAAINTPERKIWTAEDPVEITQVGLRQVQVAPNIGFTFAAALRAFLRADPDVIMVGEMRDRETASTAVEASLTGHLVCSTLHTNSAPETITRLLDMGLDPFSFADALRLVIAQRLTRALCPKCKVPRAVTEEDYVTLSEAAGSSELANELTSRLAGTADARSSAIHLHAPVGCNACGQTGYKGRLALHEVLVGTEDIRRAMARRAPADEIRTIALHDGMSTLMQDGVAKVLAGLTDLKQVMAVCTK
jgi:type II secretory ATPase GspE/PulE/Tfp pilus assembly ATPase PilB-like protein